VDNGQNKELSLILPEGGKIVIKSTQLAIA